MILVMSLLPILIPKRMSPDAVIFPPPTKPNNFLICFDTSTFKGESLAASVWTSVAIANLRLSNESNPNKEI